MYYRFISNPQHPVQTVTEIEKGFSPWDILTGREIAPPEKKPEYQLDAIDIPLSNGYGHFPLMYENYGLIRQDLFDLIDGLGAKNLQIFDANINGLNGREDFPCFVSFNIVGVIDFELLRTLSGSYSEKIVIEPNDSNMILLDGDDGAGNFLFHEVLKLQIEAIFPDQVSFKKIGL
ncbi:hypothetical protein [Hahella ganghwensis]|uniref:hypothetical protein n=1 Tax=Hahella ganghwensis TaxID=286420 RepID=UPI000371C5E4|nr:hypothetical protein [Hahella ganghwensis]